MSRPDAATTAKPLFAAMSVATLLILSPANVVLDHNIQFLQYEWRLLVFAWAAWGLLVVVLRPLFAWSLGGPEARGWLLRAVTALVVVLAVMQARFDLAPLVPQGPALAVLSGVACLLVAVVWRVRRSTLVAALVLLAPLVLLEAYTSYRVVRQIQGRPVASPVLVREEAKGPNVFHLVFDEFSLLPILDREGRLDERIVPNLAAFAREATFFPEATSHYPDTVYSLASVFRSELIRPDWSGDSYQVFGHAVQGRSLFRYLKERGYRVEVFGQHIPYRKLLGVLADRTSGRESDVPLAHAGYAYLSRLFGEPLIRTAFRVAGLENATDDGFAIGAVELMALATRRAAMLPDRGVYYYLHVLLPHFPFVYTADGRRVQRKAPRLADYVEQIRYTDRLFGTFVSALRADGRYDDSLIIVHADHGVRYPFPDLGIDLPAGVPRSTTALISAVPESLDVLARVPLLVKAPGQRTGAVRREPVTLLDVYPTVAEVVGGVPEGVRGVSLLSPADPLPHRTRRPFLTAPADRRPGRGNEAYRVHVSSGAAGGWEEMTQAEFEETFEPLRP
ncbi:MAG TPA: sulfatase-like hydrolase/transferase [Thermodesulfobacteriota bacterium]